MSKNDVQEALDRLQKRISDVDGLYSWDDDCELIRQALQSQEQPKNIQYLEDLFKQVNTARKTLLEKTEDNYKGRCADFHTDMLEFFPDAIAVYDGDHVLTIVEGVIVVDARSAYYPFKELEARMYEESKNWSKKHKENLPSNKNIIRNAIQTPDGTILQSFHRHDYKTHTDVINGIWYMVDGGLDYLRRGIAEDFVDLTMYDDEPHSVQRRVVTWGTRGLDGKQPLEYKSIKDMETSHIEAVLNECSPTEVIENCMREELVWRGVYGNDEKSN